MSNKLEEFVKEHRGEFDVNEPSADLWHNIEAGNTPAAAAGKIAWLKYLVLGTPAVALCLYLVISGSNKNIAAKNAVNAKPIIAASPSAAIQQNELTAPTGAFQNQPAAAQEKVMLPAAASFSEQIITASDSLPKQSYFEMHDVTGINTPFRTVAGNNDPLPQPASGAKTRTDEPRNWQKSYIDILKIDTVFTGIKNIDVRCSAFDVEISSNDDERIFFKADTETGKKGASKNENRYIVKYEKQDSSLYITITNASKTKFFIGNNIVQKSLLSLNVPRYTNINITTSHGDINAKDLYGKTCRVSTSSGDVTVENINTDISVGSVHGDIKAKAIKGNLTAMLSSGDLAVTGVIGNVTAKSTHGNQVFNHITGNIHAVNVSGDLQINGMQGNLLSMSTHGSAELENYTGSPSITTVSGNIYGKSVTLTGNMKASSSHGDIRMSLLNSLGDLSFDLQTDHGNLSIEKNGEKFEDENKLLIGKGKIQVKGVTNSGDQKYR